MSKSLALSMFPARRVRFADPARAWCVAQRVLVIALTVQAVRLAWLVLVPPAPYGALPPTTIEPPAATASRLAIDAFHPRTAVAASADSSGLRLHSVRTAASGGGSAIIAGSDGRQRAFAVGDAVRPGVVLVAVAADHVLLDAGGTRQHLAFERPPANGPAAATAPARGALPSTATATPADAGIDAAELLAQAGLRPKTESGRVAGYSVIPRGDGAVLRQAGLEAGDVLLSVNGQALTPERYASLAGDLAGAKQITLTYRRGAETRTTTVQATPP